MFFGASLFKPTVTVSTLNRLEERPDWTSDSRFADQSLLCQASLSLEKVMTREDREKEVRKQISKLLLKAFKIDGFREPREIEAGDGKTHVYYDDKEKMMEVLSQISKKYKGIIVASIYLFAVY